MPKRRGFTMVELLIVVAIIAVLIALLLPAMKTARLQSQKVTCISRLRVMAQACTHYASDYQGELPYGWRKSWGHDHYRSWVRGSTWYALNKSYGLPPSVTSCTSINAYATFVTPAPPDILFESDAFWGWNYFGNRQNIAPYAGSLGYISPRKIHSKATSKTLFTCLAEDVSQNFWNSAAPHVMGMTDSINVNGYTTYNPKPGAIGVAYLDGSAAFVPFRELTPIQEFHVAPFAGGPHGTIFYHKS